MPQRGAKLVTSHYAHSIKLTVQNAADRTIRQEMADLTPKQRAFIRQYIIDRNGTQAAIRAGYSPKTAQEQASRLLSNVMIRRVLNGAEKVQAAHCEVSIERLTEQLYEDRTLARENGQPAAAVSALMGIAKLHGLLIDKKEIRSGPLDAKSDDELDAIIRGAAAEAKISLGVEGKGPATKH